MSKELNNNECNSCGKCCANILMLSEKEIKKIQKYIAEHNIQVYNRNSIFLKEDVNICPFLRKDKHLTRCAIYEVRPSICRSFNCKSKYNKDMNYNGVKAINMLLTFGGENQFSVNAPDLTAINDRIEVLQNKIKKGKRNNGINKNSRIILDDRN